MIVAFFIAAAACGSPAPEEKIVVRAEEPAAAVPLRANPGVVTGRVERTDSDRRWTAAVMRVHDEAPEIRPVALSAVDSAGAFTIELPSSPYNIPFIVAVFEDINANGSIDPGEDFLRTESIVGTHRGDGMFLFTSNETYIGGRKCELDSAAFVARDRIDTKDSRRL